MSKTHTWTNTNYLYFLSLLSHFEQILMLKLNISIIRNVIFNKIRFNLYNLNLEIEKTNSWIN